MEKQEILTKLEELLKTRAEFALIFGSLASKTAGRFGPSSDIDVAVYLKNPPASPQEKLDLYSEISGSFERPVDLVILNGADPIITMQVLSNGEVILNENSKLFLEFKTRAISQYIDFKRTRKPVEERFRKGKHHA